MARQPDEREDDDEPIDGLESEDIGGDAGRLDDESGDESESGADDQVDAAQEDRRPRAKDRVTRRYDDLARETREAREHAFRLEQELIALRQTAQARQGQQSEAEFEAQLQLMEPDQRVAARLHRTQAEFTRQTAITRMMSADAADRSAYQAKALYDQRYKKYEAEVERLLQHERAVNNRDVPRETVLAFILGKKAMEAKPQLEEKRGQAQRRVASQQARAGESRSDQSRATRGTRLGQGNSPADIEYRLLHGGANGGPTLI